MGTNTHDTPHRFKHTRSSHNPKTVIDPMHTLGSNANNILQYGLGFVPTTHTTKPWDNDIAQFSTRLLRTSFFTERRLFNRQRLNNHSTSNTPNPFKLKSQWTPNIGQIHNEFVKSYIHTTTDTLKNNIDKNKYCKYNLTRQERTDLNTLKKRTDIVIRPIDKGSAVYILTPEQYNEENVRQLNNTKFYTQLQAPVHPQANDKISDIIQNMLQDNTINKDTFNYLKQNFLNPKSRIFHSLPKAHKPKESWNNGIPPGRPIISDCDTASHPVSTYIDSILQPAMNNIPSYLKDSYDTIKKVTTHQHERNIYLCTADVEALYSNIPTDQGLASTKKMLLTLGLPDKKINYIIELMNIILTHNDFKYNQQWYLQILGCAMGVPFAPCYANIFLHDWETEAHAAYTGKKPTLYYRFIDDILFFFSGTMQELESYKNHMAKFNPHVRLTFTTSTEQVNFLDITWYKGDRFRNENILDHKVYFKKTDTHSLLHHESSHPQHTFTGIVKSQILRYYRLCNNPQDFEQATNILIRHLTKYRGYKNKRMLYRLKKDMLQKYINDKTTNGHTNEHQCNTLTTNNTTNNSNNNMNTIVPLTNTQTGSMTTCNNRNNKCGIHDQICQTHHITSHSNTNKFKIIGHMECSSKNIIYMIECSKCHIQYVGQTSCSLQKRASDHKHMVKTNNTRFLYKHFNTPGHNMTFVGIEKLDTTDRTLKHNREAHWILTLNTISPQGLNTRDESIYIGLTSQHRTPFVHTYHPKIDKKLPSILQSIWEKHKNDALHPEFTEYFPGPPLVAYRKNKSLKDILTHTNFTYK